MTRDVVALANEYYEAMRSLDKSHTFNMRIIERNFKLKAGQLYHYRANRKRRKVGGVKLIHTGGNRSDLRLD